MFGLGLFMAGFASGWITRSAVDSSHELAVGMIATAYGAYDRTKRVIAIEREHLEDLVAEGKARYEAKRARSARSAQTGPQSASAVGASNGAQGGSRVAEVPRSRTERAA